MTPHALLTVSIGPVGSFITQARRVADQWSASRLLSKIVGEGVETVLGSGGEMVFPYVETLPPPEGLTNRLVCRVPRDQVETIASRVEAKLRQAWADKVDEAARIWTEAPVGQEIGDDVLVEQAKEFLEVAWSWVPEEPSYPEAMDRGARRFAASRMFRPFVQSEALGEKCALCGERTALPDGRRGEVRRAWREAAARTEGTPLERYFREDQGRLCLVCLTKRLYPVVAKERHLDRFGAFDRIGMTRGDDEKDLPYFALVSMDGDRVGRVLGWGESRIRGGRVREFQQALSKALHDFADSLRRSGTSELETGPLGYDPETPAYLVYAGGEDVVFYCHPRDAFPLARAVRRAFLKEMEGLAEYVKTEDLGRLTISAGILFAHSRRPAGLSFADVGRLLKLKAKREAGRNAVALRLDKRSGRDVEVAFQWNSDHPDRLAKLSTALRDRRLASRTTYRFTDEERILSDVFEDEEAETLWTTWLTRRLSVSGEVEEPEVEGLAELLAPLLAAGHPEALRIARFLGREAGYAEPEGTTEQGAS